METKNYFQHDYRSRVDIKLMEVRMKHGIAGFGAYWCLVEMLHEGNGVIKMKPEVIAFELQCDIQMIKDIISICFNIENDEVTCDRVKENLEIREQKRLDKSVAGKKGMEKRWSSNNDDIEDDNTPITKHNKPITKHNKPITKHNIEIEKEKEKEKEINIDKDKLLAVYTAEPKAEIENTDVDYMIDESDYEITKPMLERVIDKFIAVDNRFKFQSVMREIDEDYGGFQNLIELYLPNDTSAQTNFNNKLNQYRNGIFA
jgi:hypothetical protein